jgi:3-oxoacyl-[acyl-carrier-protein] synthase II
MHKSVFIDQCSSFPGDFFPKQDVHPFTFDAELGWVKRVGETEEAWMTENPPTWIRMPDRLHRLLHGAVSGLVGPKPDLVVVGTSRGATGRLEEALKSFVQQGTMGHRTSPLTTMGGVSAMVSQQWGGMGLEVSQTCSSGLQALLNGMAWLGSGMAHRVWAGAAEAPLTPFTVEMMRKTGILWAGGAEFPPEQGRGTVLAEGAVMLSLNTETGPLKISGWGSAIDKGVSGTGLDVEGKAYRESMERAMSMAGASPDLVILHAPGTAMGDAAELAALKGIFGNDLPLHWSTKPWTGHTLGVAGLVNVSVAWALLVNGDKRLNFSTGGRRILLNAMGFGGNAVSLMVEKTDVA